MARNLEAKFRLADLGKAATSASGIGYVAHRLLVQRDTFFVVAQGKLKLREEGDGAARLIGYTRREAGGLQVSDYRLVPVADVEGTRAVLAETLGVLAEVRKRRQLFLHGPVRLHLDEVEGLGQFGEIEAVVGEGQDVEVYRAFVDRTLKALGVLTDDLIEGSYFEMLAALPRPTRSRSP